MKKILMAHPLRKKYTDLHKSKPVQDAADRSQKRTGDKLSKPDELIQNYLDRFREILDRKDENDRERGVEAIRRKMHELHVIKEDEVPESYFDKQREMARQQGHGEIEITGEARKQLTEVLIADQRSTLDRWLNYLTSHDAEVYPDWAKYWAFRSMLGLSTYDKEKKRFAKRRKDTVAPFPDLNREALAYVVDIIVKKADGKRIDVADDNPELQKLIDGENFAKLYAYAIGSITPTEQAELEKTAGEWITYPQGSDHMPLVKSLQGHGTGWCTAGESTAQAQLEAGDFHCYYSYDQNGKPTIPRVAIRMEYDEIAEVRGVAAEQNLDPYMAEIAEEKLAQFPDGPAYQKKVSDMKRLTALEKKHRAGEELSKDELRFLYELDDEIQGFGYERDPRVDEIRSSRDIEEDAKIIDMLAELEKRLTNQPKHYKRLGVIDFAEVRSSLEANPKALETLAMMEITGGRPDIVAETDTEYIFSDCSKQSPLGRRNMDWNQSYKMSQQLGCQMMDEDTYRNIQALGQFDTNSWSWLADDPAQVKESGRALHGRRVVVRVFVDRTLASYRYENYGWRALLRVLKS